MTAAVTVLGLVAARIRHRPARGLLAAFGVALSLAATCLTLGLGTLTGDLELRHAVSRLAAGDRTLTITMPSSGADDTPLPAADQRARDALAEIGGGGVRRQVLYSALSDLHAQTFWLAGVDQLPTAVHVESGRLPQICTPTHCEVVVVGSSIPQLDPTLGLVVVGRAALSDPLVLSGTFAPGEGAPILLADGVDPISRLEAGTAIQRAYGWVAPLDTNQLRVASLPALLARTAAVSDRLRDPPPMVVTAPDDALAAAAADAHAASRRLFLVGGECAALLAGFAILAALGLRREHRAALALLRARGGSRPVLGLFTLAEAAWPVVMGLVIGLAGGIALVVLASRSEGTAAAPVLRAGLTENWAVVAAAAIAALVLVAAMLRLADAAPRRRIWPTDIAAIIAIAAAWLASSRGSTTTAGLATRSDPFLAALPVLTVVAGGLLAMHLAPPILRWIGRLLPSRYPLGRLALVDVLRRPLRPLATVAFLVGAVAIALFASAYRATLDRGAADQAAHAVPFDVTLREGRALLRPTDVAPLAAYRALAPGTGLTQVLRQDAAVRTSGTGTDSVELVGVDASALPLLSHYRGGGPAPSRLASLLRAPAAAQHIAGAGLAPGARTLQVTADADLTLTAVDAVVAGAGDRVVVVPLDPVDGLLQGVLPPDLGARRLVGFVLRRPSYVSDRIQHHVGEGTTSVATTDAIVRIHGIRTEPGSKAVAIDWNAMLPRGGSTIRAFPGGAELRAQLSGALSVVRYRQATDAVAIPVLVDPQTAAAAGNGGLRVVAANGTQIQARVIGTANGFPTVGNRFVVADLGPVRTALDADQPGTGTPGELWLRASGPAAERRLATALAARPFDQLDLARRSTVEHDLRSDPLARGALALLGMTALTALVLVVVALVLVVIADRRDDEATLLALEATGATPGELRQMLAVGATGLVLVGAPLGVLCGLLLTRAVTSLVAVTATAQAPVPPLVAATGPGTAVIAVAVALAVGLCAAAATALCLFREPLPPVPHEVAA
jgi:hypothetical protein